MTPAERSIDALEAAAAQAQRSADYPALERTARELVARGEAGADRSATAWGHHYLGVARLRLNDGVGAKREFERAAELFTESGDRVAASRSTMNLAMIELSINVDALAARRLYDAAEPAVRASGDPLRIARALGNLGEIYRLEGDYRAALGAANEALAIFERLGEHARAAWQLTNAAHLHALLRDYPAAMEALRMAYEALALEPRERWIAWYVDVCAIIAAKMDRWETAAQLLGFADRLRDEHTIPRTQVMLPWLSEPKERMAQLLSDERFDELTREGEGLTLQRAQALVETLRPA
ncbi:MAG TPA: tetratricopeptide repeat protein [Verrucomicrobiae bacterium]|nr:tetratricopeptide repeat protein [Verrucomicrobiae bacterium]